MRYQSCVNEASRRGAVQLLKNTKKSFCTRDAVFSSRTGTGTEADAVRTAEQTTVLHVPSGRV